MIGLSGRKLAFVAAMSCSVAGCTSVEYTSQAELTAEHLVMPLPKPEIQVADAAPVLETAAGTTPEALALAKTARVPGAPTIAAATPLPGSPAGTMQLVATTAVPAAQTAANAAKTGRVVPPAGNVLAMAQPAAYPVSSVPGQPQTASAAIATLELTPEMIAIQSVIPTPRPGRGIALGYAAPVQVASLSTTMDTRPDFIPDRSAPTGPALSGLISKYSKFYGVPEELIHRVVHRESRYNPKAFNRGHFGLMQIKYNTAKSMGYDGDPSGLFDAETNLRYAVKYLRGAWMVAENSADNAVRLYARGYYYDAKRKGMLEEIR
jgi:soluble lytic murein transglycosylase-like protein